MAAYKAPLCSHPWLRVDAKAAGGSVSITTQRIPRRVSSSAANQPAHPPPMTATLVFITFPPNVLLRGDWSSELRAIQSLPNSVPARSIPGPAQTPAYLQEQRPQCEHEDDA